MFNTSIYQPQATQDKDLQNLKTFLDKLSNNIGLYKQEANSQQSATLIPSNLFKMPIYQFWQGTRSGQDALKTHCSTLIPTDDHRKIWQLCDQINPNPQEYVTDVLYGLNAVEQRQAQGKDRIEKLEKHLDTLGTEIEKTNAALKSSLNDRLKKLQMQNSKLIGMVLQCYSLMESINGKYSRQSQGMNPNFESSLKTELSNIEGQVMDAESKCQELKLSSGNSIDDDRIMNKNSQDLSALFGLISSAAAGQVAKDVMLKPEAATFLDAVNAMKGYISQIQIQIQ